MEKALLPAGWKHNVRVGLSPDGTIADVEPERPGTKKGQLHRGIAIPGIPNVHSHAFQRAMAGLYERRNAKTDTFWTWRQAMYRLANQLTPEEFFSIASQLFVEMIKAGYTAVGEFHYIHHTESGHTYPQIGTLSDAIIGAAHVSGISLTHLPVLYMSSGFSRKPLLREQRRFGNNLDTYFRLIESVRGSSMNDQRIDLGLALHSLRAIHPEAIPEMLRLRKSISDRCPMHIHIAEQRLEIKQCVAWSGLRPVEWLLNNADVDRTWCLIHATHITDQECERIAASGATVGVCPSTEANLGDGIFPLKKYLAHGGGIAIGSDSNISVSPVEELRWLEYTQRLTSFERSIATGRENGSTGSFLFNACLAGGAKALGKKMGKIEKGYRADILILDRDSPLLTDTTDECLLDCFVFRGNIPVVKDVMVAGEWVVRNYHHKDEETIMRNYSKTVGKYRW